MFKRIIGYLLVVALASGAGIFLAKTQVVAPDGMNNFVHSFLPDLPNNLKETIVSSINSKRVENQLEALAVNERMNKAAVSRLALITAFGDYSGSESALTREKALGLVDYNPSVVGDLYFSVNSASEDIIGKLMENEIEKNTILHPKFTELGIAEIKIGSVNYYYVILGNEVKKVSVKVAPKQVTPTKVTWGGPELWDSINKRRVEFGVGMLIRKDELCTIASIRLNQLLELKKLDGHAGFQPTLDRADLKWIGEKYNISEYLAEGFSSPLETVKGWENTLGHRSLLVGGEYVWGCVYAQNSFAVAIAAY